MAKNEKRVSINAIDKVMKEHFDNTVVEQWNGIEVIIKRSVSFTEMLEFVNDVVESCFQADGAYVPEVMDFASKSNILTKYANFSMPDNLVHRYEFIYNTDAVEFVCEHINMTQMREIVSSIQKKIEYMCDSNVKMIQKKMSDLIQTLAGVQEKAADMFASLTPDDITRLAGALGSDGVSEDKIVEAYLQQTRPTEADGETEEAPDGKH